MFTQYFNTHIHIHTMSQRPHPIGLHCERFDTGLLHQIVEIEVDCAVHRLMREQGIMIDTRTQAAWTQTICDRVGNATFEEINAHSFMPSVMNIRLRSAVEQLIREEVHSAAKDHAENVATAKSVPWPCKLMAALVILLKKQIE